MQRRKSVDFQHYKALSISNLQRLITEQPLLTSWLDTNMPRDSRAENQAGNQQNSEGCGIIHCQIFSAWLYETETTSL